VSDRLDIAGHLALYQELGVDGISRDAAWRQRGQADSAHGSGLTAHGATQTSENPEGLAPRAQGLTGPTSCATLDELRTFIGPLCTRCKLCTLGRKQVVFGVGHPNADLMFVGEAPGADEDQKGEPFVGRAGQLLTKIIEAIGMTRDDVYIANVIKCRPPGNRNPEPDEVATCEPFLFQQIDLIKPRIIVALGTHAAHALLKTDAPISRMRGQVHNFRGGIKLIPTFHPAFLLRSPERKRDVWEDMKKVRALLAEPD
jgi:uracil-DNA glycosylase